MHPLALLCHHLLFLEGALAIYSLFVEKRFDAYSSRFTSEMPSKRVRPCKPSPATPIITTLELAFADEFLLP
jgi:hypothetical protein